MCPTERQLQQLLNGTLAVGDSPTLETHIQACQSCQQSLDRLTRFADSAWLPSHEVALTKTPTPVLPGYDLLEELGRGGYGVVFRARDLRLNRIVAIKILKQGTLADAAERSRFLNEARAAARLAHPHIVPVFEVNEAEGLPFIAMEYQTGGTLAKQLDGTPLPDHEAAKVIETLARAADYAHSQGVVHRDLKPGNVLVSTDAPTNTNRVQGTIKLADFGTARLLDSANELTPTQAILGTPSYMAPEQAFGQSRLVGPAADVYSLGAILYELLTGRPPFKAATPFETLVLARDVEPAAVRQLQPKVARDLETICAKCLEKNPQRRYATAGELADELVRFREGKPILARPIGWLGVAGKWVRRHPAASLLTAALVVLAIGSLATVTVLWRRSVERGELAEKRGEEARARERLSTDTLERTVQLIGLRIGAKAPLTKQEEETISHVLELYDQLLLNVGDDPNIRWKMVKACGTIANVYWHRGDLVQSERIHARAMELLTDLSAEFPDNADYKFEIARHLSGLSSQTRPEDVSTQIENLRRSNAILAEIRQTDRTNREWALLHSNNLTVLALHHALDVGERERLLQEAQTICDERLAVAPDDHDIRLIEMGIRGTRGRAAARIHRDWQAGLDACIAATELFKEFRKVRPKYSEGLDALSGAYIFAANYAWEMQRRSQALELLLDADKPIAEAVEQFPNFATLRHNQFLLAWLQGDVLWMTDRPKASEAYRRAKKIADELMTQTQISALISRDLGLFFCICPDVKYRDLSRASKPPIFEYITSDRRVGARYWIAMGDFAKARKVIADWRTHNGSKADASFHNFMNLLEIQAAFLQGDHTFSRTKYESAKQITSNVFELAIEQDLLRMQVAELLGKSLQK